MRGLNVWARLLGVTGTIVEGVELEAGVLVVGVRLGRRERHRCGACRRRRPRYDAGKGRRRWRGLQNQ